MTEQIASSTPNTDRNGQAISPLVSVIMPAYNAEHHIARALRSILAQTYRNFEIIVVDDGSSDNTESVIRQTAPNARYIRIKNSGPAAARNEGHRHASGEYLAFLDADDLWHPRKLELQVAYLELHREVGAVFCRWWETFPGDTEIDWDKTQRYPGPLDLKVMPEMSGWLYADLLLDTLIHTSSVMLRKALFDELGGFNQSLIIGEDYDLWIRLSRLREIHRLRATLSAYEQRADSITRTPQKLPFGATVIRRSLKKWGRRGPDGRRAPWYEVRKRIAQSYRNHGATHLKHGDLRTAVGSSVRALAYDPIDARNWRLLIKTLTNHQGRAGIESMKRSAE